MKKLNPIFISILFLFPSLSFSNATKKKVAGVYLCSNTSEFKYRLFCEKGSVQEAKELICRESKKDPNKIHIQYLDEENINESFNEDSNVKNLSKTPKFLSEKGVKSILEKKSNHIMFKYSDLYYFQEYWQEYGVLKYNSDKNQIEDIIPGEKIFEEIDKNDDEKKGNKGKKNKDDKWPNKKTALIIVLPIIAVGVVGSIGAYLFFSKKVDDDQKNNTQIKS